MKLYRVELEKTMRTTTYVQAEDEDQAHDEAMNSAGTLEDCDWDVWNHSVIENSIERLVENLKDVNRDEYAREAAKEVKPYEKGYVVDNHPDGIEVGQWFRQNELSSSKEE